MIQAKTSIGYDAPLAEVSLLQKERLAIIGENGKGKTLLKTLIGELPALGGSFKSGRTWSGGI